MLVKTSLVHTAQVRGRKIAWDGREVVQHGLNSDYVSLDLDAEWRECDRIQAVLADAGEPVRILVEGGGFNIPSSLMKRTGPVRMCLIGYVGESARIVTAKEAKPLVVVESGEMGGADPAPEQPDLWAKLMEEVRIATREAYRARIISVDAATVEGDATAFIIEDERGATLSLGIPRGPQGIQGVEGPQGEPGYTPQRGVDYWTESDQKPIDDAVRRADYAADAASKYLAGKVAGVNVTADDGYGGRPLGVVINGNSVSNLVGEPAWLSSNGITLTKNDNGSYHVSGTSTAEASFYFSLELGDLKVGDKFSMLVDADMSGIGDININAYKSSGDWNETLYAYSQAHTLSCTFGPSNGESVRANLGIAINEGESPDTDIAVTIVEGDIVPDRQYPSGVTKAEPTALLIGPLGHPERVELPSGLTLDDGDYVSIESDGKVTATVSGGASVIGTVELPDLPRGSFEASAESNIQVAVDVSYIRDMDSVVLQAAGLQRLWSGKKVVLIGTSVGFGSNAETNYITEASKYLGFSFVNASVPGQAIHTQADGRPMTYGSTVLSVAEYEGFGTTIPDAPLPDDPGGSYNSFYRTWENVFSEANKDADIWLYAVAPNNTNFAKSDWDAFDKSSWRYSDGSPFDEHRATFIGALLFLMDKMYELNPEARMAFVLDSAFAYGPNEARGNIETVAGFWHIPVIDLYGSANTSPKSLVKLQSKEGTDKHPSTFGQRLFGRMLAGRLPQFA